MKLALLVFPFLSVLSCQSDEKKSDQEKLFKEYMVLKTGNYIIYDVDSAVYGTEVSHYTYQLKELVSGTFYDNTSNLTYRIERYIRLGKSLNWILKDVWAANLVDNEYQRVEENVRYLRLIFPVKLNDYFNANKYNSSGTELHYMRNVHMAADINNFHFDSTITLIQKADTTNLVKNELIKSMYAWNTGMVCFYKDSLQLEFDPGRKGDTIGGYILQYKISEKNF